MTLWPALAILYRQVGGMTSVRIASRGGNKLLVSFAKKTHVVPIPVHDPASGDQIAFVNTTLQVVTATMGT